MSVKRKARLFLSLFAFALLASAGLELGPLAGDAEAIIGRPLSPMSFAGVARRTTRRSIAYGAMTPYPYPYAYPYY